MYRNVGGGRGVSPGERKHALQKTGFGSGGSDRGSYTPDAGKGRKGEK